MQFNRDASGSLNPLPKPSVDTGAGLVCITAVLQGKISNFDTDLFVPLMQAAAKLGRIDPHDPNSASSLRIIADHARASTFLISDGVTPSNEGRGYVLRKIIRRALRHGKLLNLPVPFFADLAYAVRDLMAGAYPELNESVDRVARVLRGEEERFARTLNIGLKKLDEDIVPLLAEKSKGTPVSFPGAKAFRLYDTYGLPLDFITDILHDQGIAFREEEFNAAMAEQRTRARASWKGGNKESAAPSLCQAGGDI